MADDEKTIINWSKIKMIAGAVAAVLAIPVAWLTLDLPRVVFNTEVAEIQSEVNRQLVEIQKDSKQQLAELRQFSSDTRILLLQSQLTDSKLDLQIARAKLQDNPGDRDLIKNINDLEARIEVLRRTIDVLNRRGRD